jgi:hypothetical protein
MVVEWIAAQNVSIPLPVYRRDCSTQCDQASIDAEDSWETRVLEDIAEDDEANASSSNSSAERLPSVERLPGPLSIAVDMVSLCCFNEMFICSWPICRSGHHRWKKIE